MLDQIEPKSLLIFSAVSTYVLGFLFRQLMSASERITPPDTKLLATENDPPDALWYLVDGTLSLERYEQMPVKPSTPGLVCEIAWLTGDMASATVIAQPGCFLQR